MKTLRSFVSLISIFVVAASAATRGPDQAGYSITDATSYSFTDIAGTGVRILADTDDDAGVVSIGFPFSFYGREYSTACVATNGLISFGGCNSDFYNQDLTAASPVGDLPTVAVYWDDLTFAVSGADAVYYQTLGTAPNRRFIVQWNNVYAVAGNRAMTFQTVFIEQSNQIRLLYKQLKAGEGLVESQGGRATIGLRDANGQATVRRVQWSYQSPVIADASALLVLPAGASVASVVNAASFLSGPLAPNTILSLFGSNLGCASGIRLLVNGKAADVLYSGPSQVNFVAPNALAQATALLQADCEGAAVGQLNVDVAETAPALFTATASGKGQASILNQDYSVNGVGAGAESGSVVMVYGTGFGRAKSPDANGLSWLETSVTATVCGLPAEVGYAGLAPGMTPGLQQINVKIPEGCAAGIQSVELQAGGLKTQKETTLVVR